ncbi:hypothetical protein HON01_03680 [Candidatus Woesearchaeota archaeon]|nr:hypothetical protein [Candidatus Woesearchaeota archaeon]MBT7367128.1 hypothetical protein [Candidatus Woesearchaeota archaeon]
MGRKGFGKKGQITVFMIIGIILLFSTAMIFYIREQVVDNLQDEFIPQLAEIPLEAQPIRIFVENCLKETTKDALHQIGLHGGYVDPMDFDYSGRSFTQGLTPTDSDMLQFYEGNDKALIPYWWYLASENDCTGNCMFDSTRPELAKIFGQNSIEAQVDKYIEYNLYGCVDGFKSFKEQGFDITIEGEIDPDFKTTEKAVTVYLKWPIKLTKDGREIDIESYFAKLDVPLKEMYQMASEIVNTEASIKFIEQHVLNLISMYSNPPSESKIPPTRDFTFGYGEYRMWTRTETQEKIENYVLPQGMAMLQVFNSNNYRRQVIFNEDGYARTATGIMDKTAVNLNSSYFYPDIAASFIYLDWWPIYLNMGDAEILKPRSVSAVIDLIPGINADYYKFYYDISFPVVVILESPKAYNGEGYKFMFVIESNLRNNRPLTSDFKGLKVASSGTMVCAESQRNAGPIGIEVIDYITKEPIEKARIETAYGLETCVMGVTKIDENNKSIIHQNFPVGSGELRVNKEGYLPHITKFGSFIDEPANYTIELMPIKYVYGTVMTVPMIYEDKQYYLPTEEAHAKVGLNEKVIMQFSRVDASGDSTKSYDSFLLINGTQKGHLKFPLVPGDYEVTATLLYNKKLIIPQETQTFEIPFGDDETITLNETVMDVWAEGGVKFNNETGLWHVGVDELYSGANVTFYVLRFPLPVTHSMEIKNGPDLSQFSKLDTYTGVYRDRLEPKWFGIESEGT